MRTLQQVVNVLMMVLFVFAAVLQYNDDDMLRWMVIYLVAASCCVGGAVGRLKWWLPALVATLCVGWAAVYVVHGLWSMPFGEVFAEWETTSPRVIEARDMFGLGVITVWMSLLATSTRQQRRDPA